MGTRRTDYGSGTMFQDVNNPIIAGEPMKMTLSDIDRKDVVVLDRKLENSESLYGRVHGF
ncbi:hypothetical protein HF325_004395 [Metschnikowia pulcherrima]|uniref:Uncharacterized protein n=1 Tax=Metschnikowia pulcherrima TaxID=27326 RepID=A0A8H7GQE2_9ASCO|nr:hypothetical protein HF325_004395 [Metschnikowia pulcherrima]